MSTHKDALPYTRSRLIQLEQRVDQLETCSKAPSLIKSKLSLANLFGTIMNADVCSLLITDESTCVTQSS